MTQRLRQQGEVQLELLFQGSRRLWPQECQDLACAAGHVREVLLLLDGRPAVWARSATPHAALGGPWKAMLDLGTRPLAELLFGPHSVPRSGLKIHALPTHGLHAQRMQELPGLPRARPRWARSSVFRSHGQPLRVFEAFFPDLLLLPVK